MTNQQSAKKDQYYTKDHEWIDFQGAVAYIGICKFKLTGFKQIQEICFNEPSGFKKQGEVVATVKYNDYLIEAHMPVDGKVMQVNEKLVSGNPNILLDCAESSAWIALIVPSLPHERKDLLLPKQYQMNGKSKYAKQ
jgi:glycine cleavage system H protein